MWPACTPKRVEIRGKSRTSKPYFYSLAHLPHEVAQRALQEDVEDDPVVHVAADLVGLARALSEHT